MSAVKETDGSASTRRLRNIVGGLLMAATLFAAAQSDNKYFLGGAVVALGMLCLTMSLTHSDEQMRHHARNTAGPGWWIGRLSAKLPGAGARIAFAFISVGMIALGIVGMVAD
jgi:hypothetical protein